MTADARPQADAVACREACPPLLAGYAPAAADGDLMMDAQGGVRPHWRTLMACLAGLTPAELDERKAGAERLFHENGIAYDAFADPGLSRRPRAFDACPLILSADEWHSLEAGLIQYARLLNALLVDAYGPQRLIAESHLPAALILGNPQFLRPCHGFPPKAGGPWLHTFAADLLRGADGTWRVVRCWTEAPSGSGHALENRIILSHSLPELFEDHQVRRLTAFFQHKRDGLAALTGRDDPRIAVLTAGPDGDSFLADSVLARSLGYPLVEGGDLTVRSEKVYLKTVEGLMPVDGLVRKIASADIDPLVMGTESNHGVAGLVGAARAGSVAVANAIGSGLVETPALIPFLPGLCRALFGEALHLDGLPAWWGGDAAARSQISADLETLLIGPAFRRQPRDDAGLRAGAALSDADRARLRAHLAWRGYDLVARPALPLATIPAWSGNRLEPRPFLLRAFVTAGPPGDAEDGATLRVLPGGYAMVPPADAGPGHGPDSAAETLVRLLSGATVVSKDVWVLAAEAAAGVGSGGGNGGAPAAAPAGTVPPAPARRTTADLPSRAADNMFWLGRYAERAEGILRLVRAVLLRLEGGNHRASDLATLTRLTNLLADKGAATPDPAGDGTPPVETRDALIGRLSALLFEPDRGFGLRETISHLQRVSVLVRDRLSADAWRALNGPTLEVGPWRTREGGRFVALTDQLTDALQALAAFSGLQMENMTRSAGWRFLMLGRRIERARALAEMLRVLLVEAGDGQDVALSLLLDVADSFMTYRSRFLARPMMAPVLDLLLLDETNPRSLAFQLAALQDGVDRLPRATDAAAERTPDQRTALSMLARLRLSEREALCAVAPESDRRETLDALLQAVEETLPTLSDQLARAYFSHAERNRAEATRADDLSEP